VLLMATITHQCCFLTAKAMHAWRAAVYMLTLCSMHISAVHFVNHAAHASRLMAHILSKAQVSTIGCCILLTITEYCQDLHHNGDTMRMDAAS
jgi:hypothetical protein